MYTNCLSCLTDSTKNSTFSSQIKIYLTIVNCTKQFKIKQVFTPQIKNDDKKEETKLYSVSDYNGDFTSPSRGPPPIRHPPGAFHNSVSSSRVFSFFRNLVFSNSLLYACRQLFCSYSTTFATR